MSHEYLSKPAKLEQKSSKDGMNITSSPHSNLNHILYLQQTIGNQATIQLLRQQSLIQREDSTDSDTNTNPDEELLLDPDEIEAIENGSESDEFESDSGEEFLLDLDEIEALENSDNETDGGDQHPQQALFDRSKAIVDYRLNRLDEVDLLFDQLTGAIANDDFVAASSYLANIAQDAMFVNPHFSAYGGRFHGDDIDTYDLKMAEIEDRAATIREGLEIIVKEYYEHPQMYLAASDYVEKRDAFQAKADDFKKKRKEALKAKKKAAKESKKADKKTPKEKKADKKWKKQQKKYGKKKYAYLRDRTY